MKKVFGLCLVLLVFSAQAQAVDLGVGLKVGVNGIGVDLSVGLSKTVNLRLSTASIDIDDEDDEIEVGDDGGETDLDAEFEFDYGANAILLDWHIFDSGFRLTGGMMRNNGAVDLTAALQGNVVLDGEDLAPGDIRGDISGEIELAESFQPYIGIGWGRGAGGEGGLSFNADVGIALLDTSVDLDAEVRANGPNGLNDTSLQRRLDAMAKDAEDELDDLELWPVLAVGINYAF